MQALNASLISACAALLYWTSWDTYHIYPNIRQQSYTIPHLKYRGLEYVSHIIIVYKVKQVLHKYFPEKGAVKGDILYSGKYGISPCWLKYERNQYG